MPPSIARLELQVPTQPPLGASLGLPEQPRAAALMIQGSGPHDRDGAMPPFGFRSTLYRRLAERLGESCGLITLRYDKRGFDLPPDAPRDYSVTSRLDDAQAALSALRSRPESAGVPLFVIGHSEGARIAAKLAETEQVTGVVSLAAPYGSIYEVNRERARWLSTNGSDGARRRGERALELLNRLEELFKKGEQLLPEEFSEFAKPYFGEGYYGWESFDWLKEHWENALEVERATVPTLVLQGGSDARLPASTAENWRTWCEAQGNATFCLLPEMGHDLNDARRKAFVLYSDVVVKTHKFLTSSL